MIRRRRWASGICLCRARVSPIWRSIRCSGLSEVMGSWKTMAMRLPRIWRSRVRDAPSSSSPAKRMLPEGWRARG